MFPLAFALGEVGKVLDGFGRVLFKQTANDGALGCIECCVCAWLACGCIDSLNQRLTAN